MAKCKVCRAELAINLIAHIDTRWAEFHPDPLVIGICVDTHEEYYCNQPLLHFIGLLQHMILKDYPVYFWRQLEEK